MINIDSLLDDIAEGKKDIILESYQVGQKNILLEDYNLPDDIDNTDAKPADLKEDGSQTDDITKDDGKDSGDNNTDDANGGNDDQSKDDSKYSLDDNIDSGDTKVKDGDDLDDGTDVLDNQPNEPKNPANTIPDISVLNLSSTDKQLNNYKLYRRFRELFKNVDDSLNNISSKVTKTARQKQVMDVVASNLGDMLDDLEMYMLQKFNNVYETNMTIYLTYLKRYKIAMELVRLACDESVTSHN